MQAISWYWKATLIWISNVFAPEINIVTENGPFINVDLGQFLGEGKIEKVYYVETKKRKKKICDIRETIGFGFTEWFLLFQQWLSKGS